MVRIIGRRHTRVFKQNALLLQSAVRHIAVFSSQSEQAAQAASQIELISSDPEPQVQRQPAPAKPEVILPPGVDRDAVKRPAESPISNHVQGLRFEANVEELPDDEQRKVVPDRPAEDKNKPGSFESMMSFAGRLKEGNA